MEVFGKSDVIADSLLALTYEKTGSSHPLSLLKAPV